MDRGARQVFFFNIYVYTYVCVILQICGVLAIVQPNICLITFSLSSSGTSIMQIFMCLLLSHRLLWMHLFFNLFFFCYSDSLIFIILSSRSHSFFCITCPACVLSHIWLFTRLWTIARQAPLSMGFFRQEYWSGLPFPSPQDLSNPGIEPIPSVSPALQADSSPAEPSGSLSQLLIPSNLFLFQL